MRLLLDEMLSPTVARELRARGHDVEAIKGSRQWEGLTDPEVMDLARRERRAIVTNNVRDYRPLHNAALGAEAPDHFGMIFVPGDYRRTKKEIGRIVTALETILAAYPSDESLANGETWL